MDEEAHSPSVYETDTEIQTSQHDAATQMHSPVSETENEVSSVSVPDAHPSESLTTETDTVFKENADTIEVLLEKSQHSSTATASAKDSEQGNEELIEKVQHVQDLEHVISMDEQVETVLDLEKFDITEERVEKIDNLDLDEPHFAEEKSFSQTLVQVTSAEEQLTYTTDYASFSEPEMLTHAELLLIAPPSTPIEVSEASDAGDLTTTRFSEHFIAQLQETITNEYIESQEEAVPDDEDKRRPSETKKSVSTSRKAGFKVGSTTDVSAKYFETEFDSAREGSSIDSRTEEIKRRTECSCYAGVDKFATGFVDDIIDTSINDITTNMRSIIGEVSPDEQSPSNQSSSMHTYVEVLGTFTRWPRIQEFSRELGELTINDYMITWDYNEDWLYCINFLLQQSDECSDYYFYEAIWSIPTKPYPIPQATASIYFTIEVSRIKPPYCPVDVTYVFEGSRFIHTPGKIIFQEQWLFDIIDAKIRLFKQIRF